MDIDFSSSVGFLGLLHICVVQPTATAKESPMYPCVAMRGEPLHEEVSTVIVDIVLVREGFDEESTRPGEVPLANVAPRCRCCCWCLAWLSSVFCKLPVLLFVSINIATSCCASSLFSSAMLTNFHVMECFEITAAWLSALGAEICNVVSAVFRASSILTTVRPEIYSNDFGRFGTYFS